MCWASWGGCIPLNAVGGETFQELRVLYSTINTTQTQHNTQSHTTTNHNKMDDTGRRPPRPLPPPIALRCPLRRNSPAHHIMGDARHARFCIFLRCGGCLGCQKGDPSWNGERGRAQTIGSCRLAKKRNNQPIVGIRRGGGNYRRDVTWTDHVGGCPIVASAIKMSDRKNRERDRASALSGRHLVKRRNNQLTVNVSGGGCIKEETRQGRNMQGGAMPLFWLSNQSTKIDERKNTSWT